MKTRIRAAAALGAVALFTIALAGCSKEEPQKTPEVSATEVTTPEPTEEPTPEPTLTPEPTVEPSYLVLGDDSEEAYHILFTNGTAMDLVGVQIKESSSDEYEADLLANGTAIVPDETFQLCYSPQSETLADDVSAGDAADGRAVVFNSTYDMQLTCSDGAQFVLYDLGFEDMKDATIMFSTEDSIGYVTYTSIATGDPVDTLPAQLAHAAAEQEAASSPAVSNETGRSSGSSSSDSSDSSSGSSGSSGESSSGAGSTSNESSGGSAADDSSSSGDSGSASEPDQVFDDCLEDNIVWND